MAAQGAPAPACHSTPPTTPAMSEKAQGKQPEKQPLTPSAPPRASPSKKKKKSKSKAATPAPSVAAPPSLTSEHFPPLPGAAAPATFAAAAASAAPLPQPAPQQPEAPKPIKTKTSSSRASQHSRDPILVLISQGLNVALSPSVWTLSLWAHLWTFPHLSVLGDSVTAAVNGKGNLVIRLLPTDRELL